MLQALTQKAKILWAGSPLHWRSQVWL